VGAIKRENRKWIKRQTKVNLVTFLEYLLATGSSIL
jgi:hypothetical protein